jgi:tetratricopeptide (TPR) repeat protein
MAQIDPIAHSQKLLDEANQFMERQQWQQAEERFRQVAKNLARKATRSEIAKPILSKALTGWARCLLERGQLMEAMKIARRALSLMPDFEEAQNLFLNALVSLGKWQEAFRQVKRWLKQQSQNWRLHLWAARIEAQLEHWAERHPSLGFGYKAFGKPSGTIRSGGANFGAEGRNETSNSFAEKGIGANPKFSSPLVCPRSIAAEPRSTS